MKMTVRISAVLTIVCVVCAFLLSYVWGTAKEKIEANARKMVEDSINAILPEAASFKESPEEDDVFLLYDEKQVLLGYAFIAQGQGYQGKIKILAVSGTSFDELAGIEIVESVETPGLGAKIQESPFKSQFAGLQTGPITCVKTKPQMPGQIQAITGATVSSKAVVNILNARIEELKKIFR